MSLAWEIARNLKKSQFFPNFFHEKRDRKFREQFVNPMSTVDAFEAIGETVEVLLSQTDESNAIEVVQTLIALARQSDTTEIPSKLLSKKMAIESQFSKFCGYAKNQMQELFYYYRL